MTAATAAEAGGSRTSCPNLPATHSMCPACRQFFQEQYQSLDAELFSSNRTAFPAQAFNADSFTWAVATVRSRLHQPLDTDNIALVPLADAVRLLQKDEPKRGLS